MGKLSEQPEDGDRSHATEHEKAQWRSRDAQPVELATVQGSSSAGGTGGGTNVCTDIGHAIGSGVVETSSVLSDGSHGG